VLSPKIHRLQAALQGLADVCTNTARDVQENNLMALMFWCLDKVDCVSAGVVALPAGAAFPGMTADSKAAGKAAATAKRPIFFATAGERGTIRIWRWAHGAAVAECTIVQCLAVHTVKLLSERDPAILAKRSVC
jgi:hypothetical protein